MPLFWKLPGRLCTHHLNSTPNMTRQHISKGQRRKVRPCVLSTGIYRDFMITNKALP